MTHASKAALLLATEKAQADSLNAKRFKFLIEHLGSLRATSETRFLPDGHEYVHVHELLMMRCLGCKAYVQCNHDDLIAMIDQHMKQEGL